MRWPTLISCGELLLELHFLPILLYGTSRFKLPLTFASSSLNWSLFVQKTKISISSIFESLYLGNAWWDLVEIWNVWYWQWQASEQQKSSGFVQAARNYVSTKIALLFGCGMPASWAARHTTVCLDYLFYHLMYTLQKIMTCNHNCAINHTESNDIYYLRVRNPKNQLLPIDSPTIVGCSWWYPIARSTMKPDAWLLSSQKYRF